MRTLRWWPLVAGAVAVAGCAAPSRQLTTRIVEDPITLPRRMASVSVGATAIRYEPTDAQGVLVQPGFRFGVTDRLEWVDLLGLRYAILDDRPADGRAPGPVSLAVRAGAFGIGYSSAEGMIVLPVVSAGLLRHVDDRWAVALSASWTAQWTQHAYGWTPAYNDTLVYLSRRRSALALGAAVTRQLSARVALTVGPSVAQMTDCTSPACDWKSRSAAATATLGMRPLSWLTVNLGPSIGIRERPDVELPTTFPDGRPIAIPPLRVKWAALTMSLDFYW